MIPKHFFRGLPLAALLACGSALGGINSWTMTGPDAGSANIIAVHPENSQIALLSTPRGLYRTANGGDSWSLVNEHVFAPVESIAFDPQDPDRVFAANGDLWRSDDAGQTFVEAAHPATVGIHSLGFTSAGTLYAHTRIGQVYRSTDQGGTWTTCAIPGDAYSSSNAFAVDPNANVDRLLIDAQFPGPPVINVSGTYRSVDGCASWQVAGAGDPVAAGGRVNEYSVMPGDSNYLLAATNIGLWRSTDGGDTWALVQGSNSWSVKFDPTEDGNGQALAVMTSGTVLVSTDSGANWISRGSLYSLGAPSLTFDPLIHGRVWGTTLHGAFLSTNGGASFALRASGVRAGVVGDFSTADDGTVYVTFSQGASGVFRRDPATRAWGPVPNQDLVPVIIPGPLYMTHVATAPTDSSRLFAGISSAFIVGSTDGGSSWRPYAPEFISPVAYVADTVVDPDNEQVAYTTTSNRGVWKTIDGGASWTQLPGPLETWTLAAARGSDVVYVSAGSSPNQTIYKSENGGASWADTSFPALPPFTGGISEIVIDPADVDRVYVSTGSGIYRTTNGGATWALMNLQGLPTPEFNGRGIAVDPLFPSTLVASHTLFGAGLARSVDSGATWQPITLTLPGVLTYFDRVVLDPLRPNVIIAGVQNANIGEYEVATDLELTGPALSSPLSASTSVSANYRIRNLGQHGASPSRLTISFPAWATPAYPGICSRAGQTLDCLIPPLNTGGDLDVPVTFAISASGGTGALTANLTTHETDLVPANNSHSLTIAAVERADLSLSLSPGSTTVERGESVTLTARVTNRGPSPSTATTLALDIPAGLTVQGITPSAGSCTPAGAVIDCALGTVAVNDEVTVAVQLLGSIASTYDVTAEADGSGLDSGNDENAVASVVVTAVGDVSVSLAESADPVTLGESFSYTVTLRHVSGDTAGVQLAIPISGAGITGVQTSGATCSVNGGEVSCNVTSMAAGATATVTISLDAIVPGVATATATATFAGRDTNSANNTAVIGTTLRQVGDLGVQIVDNVDPATVDMPFIYTVTLHNAGPNAGAAQVLIPVSGALLTGAVSPGGNCSVSTNTASCNVPSIASGASTTIAVTVVSAVPGAASASATATFSGVDVSTANNNAVAVTTVRLLADVSATVTGPVDPATVDSSFDYVVTVHNAGPNAGPVHVLVPVSGASVTGAALNGGTCTNTATSVTCNIPSLANDASAVLTIGVVAGSAGPASATATANFLGDDLNFANDTATANTVVRLVGDLNVTVTDSADPVTTGASFSYTVTVRNDGPNAGAVNVSVPVTGATVASATMAGAACTHTASSVSCDLAFLASNASATLTINVSSSAAGTASAAATVTFSGTDLNAANNSATANTVVNAPPAAPPAGGGGSGRSGGGGGRFDWLFAGLLGLLVMSRPWRLQARGTA